MAENGILLLADISGYTEFIKLHNLAKKPVFGAALAKNFESHASIIVSAVLPWDLKAKSKGTRCDFGFCIFTSAPA